MLRGIEVRQQLLLDHGIGLECKVKDSPSSVAAQMKQAKAHRLELLEVELRSGRAGRLIGAAAGFSNLGPLPESRLGESGLQELSGAVMPTVTLPCGSFCAFNWRGHLRLTQASRHCGAPALLGEIAACIHRWSQRG